MKRMTIVSVVCAVVLLLGVSAQAGTWSSDNGDFSTKFWKEMFKGGGVGYPGNVLMALGDGFIFNKAVLESIYFDEVEERWITTYVDGELNLNSSGPWLDKGKLRATGISAINSSAFNPDTGELDFVLTFSGEFDNEPGCLYDVEVSYFGIPDFAFDDYGDPVFQRGFDFSVEITISE